MVILILEILAVACVEIVVVACVEMELHEQAITFWFQLDIAFKQFIDAMPVISRV